MFQKARPIPRPTTKSSYFIMESTRDTAEQASFLNDRKETPAAKQTINHTDRSDYDSHQKVYSFNLSTDVLNRLESGNKVNENLGGSKSLEKQKPKKGWQNYIGILLALFAGCVFTIGSLLAKNMKNYHAFTIATYRVQGIFVPSIFMVLYATKIQKIKVFEPIWPLGEDGKWKTFIGLILRAAMGIVALTLHFYAIKYLTVGDVAVISSCKSILVTLAAFVFLGETCGYFPVLMAFLTMVGVGVITRPPILTGEESFDMDTLIGAAYAMGSVITYTSVFIFIRSLKHIHVSVMMLFLGCWGTLQSTLCAYLIGELKLPESGQDWAYTLGMAVAALLSQVAMNMALQFEQANPVAVTRTMDFIFAFVLQFVFMGVVPDWFSVSGAAIIIMCVFLTAFRKYLNTLPKTHVSRKRFWFVLR